MSLAVLGASCFGVVVGWISYRRLWHREATAELSDISCVIGAVGGAGVTALFKSEAMFGLYSIGLATGFFGYFLVSLRVHGTEQERRWMGY